MATYCSNIELLPEDCVCSILSYLSPAEACTFSLVSPTLHSAADSDTVWKSFLPSNYEDILSRAVNPLPLLQFSHHHKQLFQALSHPLPLDAGNKIFQLDKSSGKISYILSATELSIAWSQDTNYWTWTRTPESRFSMVAELRTVNWLQIEGKMRTGELTERTTYGAYLIMKVSSNRAYGLDSAPAEISVAIGDKVVQRGKAYLCQKDEKKRMMERLMYGNRRHMLGNEEQENIPVPLKRQDDDGWMEIQIGEFFTGDTDQEINITLMEVGYHLKAGLIVQGIHVRPKH
ncbi:hypothetical protein HN51_014720 [Arachis hypogaea]|nr:F-box protein [Arachis hypogaea]